MQENIQTNIWNRGAWLLLGLSLLLLVACGGSGGDGQDLGDDNTDPIESPGDSDDSTSAGAYFKKKMPWASSILKADTHIQSENIIAFLQSTHEDGELFPKTNGIMQIDFTSLHILKAGAETPHIPYDETWELVYGFTYGDPPCDNLISLPLPNNGKIEGSDDYQCADNTDEDCHFIVHDQYNNFLYEAFHATVFTDGDDEKFAALCPVLWDLDYEYGETLRGQNCTSADAAGFPIAPLLVTADEVASGKIEHAMRFILRNEHMRAGLHVPPATHSGAPSSKHPHSPIYGMRFRLRADYPVNELGESGRVIATALQQYGMFLVDGGNVPLTFMADDFSERKWHEFEDFGPHMFKDKLQISDFEIVYSDTAIDSTHGCEWGVTRSERVQARLKN